MVLNTFEYAVTFYDSTEKYIKMEAGYVLAENFVDAVSKIEGHYYNLESIEYLNCIGMDVDTIIPLEIYSINDRRKITLDSLVDIRDYNINKEVSKIESGE